MTIPYNKLYHCDKYINNFGKENVWISVQIDDNLFETRDIIPSFTLVLLVIKNIDILLIKKYQF